MSVWLFLFLLCVLLVAALLILLWHPLRSQTKERIPANRNFTDPIFRDDDRYWYGGVFYNNPDDPNILVPKRFGLGWTINFGNPKGRLFMIVMILLPMVIAVISIILSGGAPTGCHTLGCTP